MKSHPLLRGSGTGLAAVIHVDTTVGFLTARDEATQVSRVPKAAKGGYVWRKVFLRRKRPSS